VGETERPAQHIVLLLTDLVGSAALKTRFGTAAYADLISRHDELFRGIVSSIGGSEIVKDTGDGFLARFATTGDAVNAALRFQCVIHTEAWEPQPPQVRIGVHVGDVLHLDRDIDGRPKLVGLTADITARLTELALPGQILMTRAAFDDARQYVHEHPLMDAGESERPRLKWMAHGAYLFKGVDEPVQVFEVGAAGLAPLNVPPSGGKAQRIVLADEEETLGWRPAVGLDVPQRENWRLRRKLGEGGFGEVWLAQNRQTHVERVFKFCFDAERVRSLKREVTLFRLLRDALGNRDDIAKLYEIQLEHAPYCLESEFTELGSMSDWTERQGGLDGIPLATRLDLVARTADAVAAAHSIGILHKDIKPSNVLIYQAADGSPRPRLADFGIGALTDQAQLERRNITATGFTETLVTDMQSSLTGTRMYAPPELLAGKPFTIQGDVYALGVLLYQMLVGDLTRPVATGWERDVSDSILREDVAACVDGDPARRLSGATDLAERLRSLEVRHKKRQQEEEARLWARRREKLVRRALAASIVLGLLLVLAGFSYYRERRLRIAAAEAREQAEAAQREAERQTAIAQAVNDFLQEDLLAAANPQHAPDREMTVREALDAAAAKVAGRFENEPLVEASIQATLGYTYLCLGQYAPAEQHLKRALQLRSEELGEDHPGTLAVINHLAQVYRAQDRYDDAEPLFVRTLEIRRRVLGADHPDTLQSMNNLAHLYNRQGRYDKAEALYIETLETCRRVLGEDHVGTLAVMNNLALLYKRQGRYDQAEPLYARSLELRRAAFGKQHPYTLTAMNNLASLYAGQGRYDEAEPLYLDVFETISAVLGEEHPDTLSTMDNLGLLCTAQGRFDEAVTWHRQALEGRRRVLGNEHRDTLRSLRRLAAPLIALEKFDEAEALLLECHDRCQRAFGSTHAETSEAIQALVDLYTARGDPERASQYQALLQAAPATSQPGGGDAPAPPTAGDELRARFGRGTCHRTFWRSCRASIQDRNADLW
jgi:serine/threonine protein kinase/class 3 adenylate cyclase